MLAQLGNAALFTSAAAVSVTADLALLHDRLRCGCTVLALLTQPAVIADAASGTGLAPAPPLAMLADLPASALDTASHTPPMATKLLPPAFQTAGAPPSMRAENDAGAFLAPAFLSSVLAHAGPPTLPASVAPLAMRAEVASQPTSDRQRLREQGLVASARAHLRLQPHWLASARARQRLRQHWLASTCARQRLRQHWLASIHARQRLRQHWLASTRASQRLRQHKCWRHGKEQRSGQGTRK